MADGEVRINTKLDTTGVDKGIKDLNKKLDNAGKQLDASSKQTKGLTNSLSGLTKGAVGTAAAVAGVAVAVKKTVDALNNCEAAYQKQRKAEIALQQAAKNNPYLNDESVYNLRQFASELQNVSEIGDEMSLQVMSQLAATGRTENEIIQIMSAAADMAAVTGQDIGSAAQQLNATLNGVAGTLGRQVDAINNLTKEELEAGKAIEIVAAQYKGSAAAMADTTVQLSNAWGDFKENIGRGWNKVTQPVKKFFLDVLNDINEATAKTNAIKEADAASKTGDETATQAKLRLDEASAFLKSLEENRKRAAEILEMTDKDIKKSAEYMEFTTWSDSGNPLGDFKAQQQEIIKQYEAQSDTVDELTRRYNFLAYAEEYDAKKAQENAEATAAANKAKAEATQRDKDATDHINANQKALAQQIEAMKMQADLTGEEIDAGEMYNVYLNSYIDLVTKSNGLVSEGNSAAKARLALLNEWAEKAKNAQNEEERLAATLEAATEAAKLAVEVEKENQKESKKLHDEIYGDEALNAIDKFKARAIELADLRIRVNQDEIMSDKEKNDALLKLDEDYAQSKKDLWQGLTSEISGYVNQTADIAQQAGDLMLQNVQLETENELAALEDKYNKGELAETEYYEKQKEIKRKAAREEYKIQMFQWTAAMLTATANIAEGVTKAIAQGGLAGIVSGALVGAAGAVQIASIIASKPTPPSFYTGGVIGGMNGATMGGDNTYIHARSGEMILNANQQRALWDRLNGQSGREYGGVNLTVNNTQSGRVDTTIQQQPNGDLVLNIIDKRINRGLSDGTYDAGFAAMNTRQEGERIL